jgi:hypothetical protein
MKLSVAFFLSILFGLAQPPVPRSQSGSSGAPTYVLYRLFFRDIAARDTAAAQLALAGKPGSEELRKSWQKSLFLTEEEASLVRQVATRCNQALDQHHATALPTIMAARASIANRPDGAGVPKPPQDLMALEEGRTDISNGCIRDLRSALGNRTFSKIDVFIRTKFVQKVSSAPPAGSPFGATPPVRLGVAEGSR